MTHAKLGWPGLAACALLALDQQAAPAQEIQPVAHTTSLSDVEASLSFELADESTVTISFTGGIVRLNGADIGSYRTQGAFELAWRDLVGSATELSTVELLDALRQLPETGLTEVEIVALESIRRAVGGTLAQRARAPAPVPPIPEVPDVAVGAVAAADIAEAVEAAEAVAQELAERVAVEPAESGAGGGGVLAAVMKLISAFFGLTLLGFGMLFFAPKQLEAISDTVWNSFWRSFLAGLFAQPLIVPVFGMLIVGLALTVVGVLVIPFAAVAFVVALGLAIVGGYIAVARAVGEIYLRRKMSGGTTEAGTWVALRYIAFGLIGLLAIWLPAVLLGWIPVLGTVATVMAVLITWILATAGFGATILTRGGIRGTIMRRLDRALTDEHYWPTAESLPIAGRRAGSARSNG